MFILIGKIQKIIVLINNENKKTLVINKQILKNIQEKFKKYQ